MSFSTSKLNHSFTESISGKEKNRESISIIEKRNISVRLKQSRVQNKAQKNVNQNSERRMRTFMFNRLQKQMYTNRNKITI